MKNAKLKLTEEAAASRGWKLVERNTMPVEVALDYLCTLERTTNSMRKIYSDARVRVFQAVQQKKPAEVKLSARAGCATLAQLGKWTRRMFKRRRGLQRKYELAIQLPDETTKQDLLKRRLIAGLNLCAGAVDLAADSFQNEIEGRQAACKAK